MRHPTLPLSHAVRVGWLGDPNLDPAIVCSVRQLREDSPRPWFGELVAEDGHAAQHNPDDGVALADLGAGTSSIRAAAVRSALTSCGFRRGRPYRGDVAENAIDT